jgi:hypothetical protein
VVSKAACVLTRGLLGTCARFLLLLPSGLRLQNQGLLRARALSLTDSRNFPEQKESHSHHVRSCSLSILFDL